MTISDAVTSVAAARVHLQTAHDDLAAVVRALPGLETDNTMATPTLIAVLQRVTVARRHLAGLERG